MTTYIYTSIALNYLPKARVLSTTLKKYHPDYKMCIVLAESITDDVRAKILEFEDIDLLLTMDDLVITDGFGKNLTKIELLQWQFKHSIVEFCTAIKGSALCDLLSRPDCEQVFYFDPDIAIFDKLNRLTQCFNDGYSIILTPHTIDIEYTQEDVWRNEISNLKHGIYNLGFIGVKNDATGYKFASWWKSRLDMYCYDDIPNGVFTDQSWCDMVPAVFDNVKVLREPQYNVSTWNLTHRTVDGLDINNLNVNQKYKLCFYHFSGFDSGAQIAMLLKYARYMPKLFLLRRWYKAECKKLDDPYFNNMKWSFGYYTNGDKIGTRDRKIYRLDSQLQAKFSNPFNNTNLTKSYKNYLNECSKPDNKNIDFYTQIKQQLKQHLLRFLHKIF